MCGVTQIFFLEVFYHLGGHRGVCPSPSQAPPPHLHFPCHVHLQTHQMRTQSTIPRACLETPRWMLRDHTAPGVP